jgi:Na+-transporting methylmalonyl-CoA/oxaloacetate decarboxylase gamma subunit
MNNSLSNIYDQISAGNGVSLTVVGMITVFGGLILLFFCMNVLHNTVKYITYKVIKHKRHIRDVQHQKVNIAEVTAAITLAFHLRKLKLNPKKLKAASKEQSSWKMSQKTISLERL